MLLETRKLFLLIYPEKVLHFWLFMLQGNKQQTDITFSIHYWRHLLYLAIFWLTLRVLSLESKASVLPEQLHHWKNIHVMKSECYKIYKYQSNSHHLSSEEHSSICCLINFSALFLLSYIFKSLSKKFWLKKLKDLIGYTFEMGISELLPFTDL